MKLSIIIPVYNEKSTILSIIEKIKAVNLPTGIEKEIVVVDDGSTDGTKELLGKFTGEAIVKILSYGANQGKTFAVKYGIEHSSGELIIIQDADLEYSPDQYPRLLGPILSSGAAIVYGSRFMGTVKGMTAVNRLANRMTNLTVNLLYGTRLTDVNTCFKMFKRILLKDITITSQKFSFDIEITVKFLKKGYKIHEVPIDYCARSRSEGKKITWGAALQSYGVLIKSKFVKD